MSRLKNILEILSPETQVDFSSFDESIAKLKKDLQDKIEAKTLEDFTLRLEKFKKKLDFAPLYTAMEGIQKALDDKFGTTSGELKKALTTLNSGLLIEGTARQEVEAKVLTLQTQLTALSGQSQDISTLKERIAKLPEFTKRVNEKFAELEMAIQAKKTDGFATNDELKTLTDQLEKVRRELNNRINNFSPGGGANRNIAIGGNTSVLSTYTDINLKAGTNVTITYAKNQVTKYTDVTISATGGSGSGIVRSVNTVAVDTAAGAVATTDYVYLCSGTLNLTLPTSVGNSNLYTIKNIGAGTITVLTTGGETIDGQLTAVMPVQFTSIDLISNNSGNWDIT